MSEGTRGNTVKKTQSYIYRICGRSTSPGSKHAWWYMMCGETVEGLVALSYTWHGYKEEYIWRRHADHLSDGSGSALIDDQKWKHYWGCQSKWWPLATMHHSSWATYTHTSTIVCQYSSPEGVSPQYPTQTSSSRLFHVTCWLIDELSLGFSTWGRSMVNVTTLVLSVCMCMLLHHYMVYSVSCIHGQFRNNMWDWHQKTIIEHKLTCQSIRWSSRLQVHRLCYSDTYNTDMCMHKTYACILAHSHS